MARNYGPADGYGYDEIPTWESIQRQAWRYGYGGFAVQGGQLHAPFVSDQVVRDATMGMSVAMEQSAEIGNVAVQESIQAVDDFVGNEFYDLAHMGSGVVDKALGKGEKAGESGKGLSTANLSKSMEKDGKRDDGEVLTTRHNALDAAMGEDEAEPDGPSLGETLGHMGDSLGNGLEAWAADVQARHAAGSGSKNGSEGHGRAQEGETISTRHETLGRAQEAANGPQRAPDVPEQSVEPEEPGLMAGAFSGVAMEQAFDLDRAMERNLEAQKGEASKGAQKGMQKQGEKTPDEIYKERCMDAQRMLDQIDFGGYQPQLSGPSM